MKRIYQITNYTAKWNPNGTLNGKMGCHIRLDVDSAAAELDEVKAMDGTTETITGSLETHVATQAERETGETLAAGDVEIFTMLGVDTSYLTMSLGSPTGVGRALADDADTAAQRTTLGLVIGSNVHAALSVMDQAEAEAGTATTQRILTAERMKQSIDALGGELILSQEAAGSSSIVFGSAYVTSAYDVHLLVGEGIVVATDRADLYLRVSTDGGTTLKADAGNYLYAGYSTRSSGAALTTVSAGAPFIKLNPIDLSNVAAEGFGFSMYIKGAARAAAKTVFEGTTSGHDYLPRMNTGFLGGTYTIAEIVNGLGVIPDIGNITRGRFSLYRFRHA